MLMQLSFQLKATRVCILVFLKNNVNLININHDVF